MTNVWKSGRSYGVLLLGVVIILVVAAFVVSSPIARGEETQEQTAPPPPGLAKATFAAGCFWSMEAIFKQLRGVTVVYPGYSGGNSPHPSYDGVETGTTGYAESINITYDPKVISYQQLLQILLTVRNPTTVNQQGPDYGTNYRSVIFYRTNDEKSEAESAIKQINTEHIWQDPIVTEVQPYTTFYRAEGYHLNYYNLHPDEPYCAGVIAPEIANFREKYHSLLKS